MYVSASVNFWLTGSLMSLYLDYFKLVAYFPWCFLQASFLNKKLNIRGKRVNLSIWDTAGQERFHALGPIYYRDANGAILVYDITDQDSFQKVKNWVKELRKMLGAEINLAIAGNKVDLEKQRRVDAQMAEE